jgi:hypothetical protein
LSKLTGTYGHYALIESAPNFFIYLV